MKFRNVKIFEAFDFEETGFFGCIKTSPRKYKFESGGCYYDTTVGTMDVEVSNVRDAYGWELEQAGLTQPSTRTTSLGDNENV